MLERCNLIHDYIGVDLDEVCRVASSRIPELKAVLEEFSRRRRSQFRAVPKRSKAARRFVDSFKKYI
jgi:hypothetical protein